MAPAGSRYVLIPSRALLWWSATVVTTATSAPSTPPHIVLIYADDLGWGNVGWHRTAATPSVATPHLDEMVSVGVELNRMYAYSFCAPSRAALFSGRLPQNVNSQNIRGATYDAAHPEVGGQGVPRDMTAISQMLAQKDYYSVFAGKWDVGFATRAHTPVGRNYSSSLNYFFQINDYWTQKPTESEGSACNGHLTRVKPVEVVDLWHNGAAAASLNGTAFEEILLEAHMTNALRHYIADVMPTGRPLFLHYAPHLVHDPYELPASDLARFDFVKTSAAGDVKGLRQIYAAMTNYLDRVVGNITAIMKATPGGGKGTMWDTTLVVFASDNGGPIQGGSGANNWPLRGGKLTTFEGGLRVNAFLSGGFIPIAARGTKLNHLMHVADIWATLADAVGLPVADPVAAASKLPALDSISFWPQAIGANATAARTELLVNGVYYDGGGLKLWGGATDAIWPGLLYPNASTNFTANHATKLSCAKDGCLFDVGGADAGEHVDLAAARPTDVARMKARAKSLAQANNYNPSRGSGLDVRACAAIDASGGFWGPWADEEE